jgi:hypothetical protein
MGAIRYFLRSPGIIQNVCAFIRTLPLDEAHPWVIEIKAATRTLEQNSKMWAVLTDISKQVVWYGRKLAPEDWKHILSASLKKQDVVPGIDGGFVVLGLSTSKMSVREMCDLIELAHAFGTQQGVRWSEKGLDGIQWSKAA